DRRAFRRETLGNGGADSLGRSGDDRDFSIEPKHVSLLCWGQLWYGIMTNLGSEACQFASPRSAGRREYHAAGEILHEIHICDIFLSVALEINMLRKIADSSRYSFL